MALRQRCDEILRIIDDVLAECASESMATTGLAPTWLRNRDARVSAASLRKGRRS